MLMHRFNGVLLYLLTFAKFSHCDSGDYDYFKEPSTQSKNADHYLDVYGEEYAIVHSRSTFYDASVLCKARNGQLVTLIDAKDGQFLSEVLANTDLASDAFWIGGQFFGEKWIWLGRNVTIKEPTESQIFPMRGDPFWAEFPSPAKSKVQSCLGFNRLNHKSYLITPLPCGIARPFICRISSDMSSVTDSAILQAPVISGEHFDYHLYYSAFTWEQASAFCLEKDLKLASLDFQGGFDTDFYLLSHRMLRSRPVIENVWINGRYDNVQRSWLWVSDNQPISLVKNGTDAENPVNNEPPWFRGSQIYNGGCLLLDRHLGSGPVFVESRCNRKKSFVCQRNKEGGGEKTEFRHVNGTNLWLSFTPRNWMAANQRCATCFSKDGNLLSLENKVDDDKLLHSVTDAMSHWTEEVSHIWLAGHLDETGTNWNWYKSKNAGKRNSPLSLITDKSFDKLLRKTSNVQVTAESLTPKVKNLKLARFRCLNMDRENQRHVFLYGLNCEYAQSFFCESKENTFDCGDHSKSTISKPLTTEETRDKHITFPTKSTEKPGIYEKDKKKGKGIKAVQDKETQTEGGAEEAAKKDKGVIEEGKDEVIEGGVEEAEENVTTLLGKENVIQHDGEEDGDVEETEDDKEVSFLEKPVEGSGEADKKEAEEEVVKVDKDDMIEGGIEEAEENVTSLVGKENTIKDEREEDGDVEETEDGKEVSFLENSKEGSGEADKKEDEGDVIKSGEDEVTERDSEEAEENDRTLDDSDDVAEPRSDDQISWVTNNDEESDITTHKPRVKQPDISKFLQTKTFVNVGARKGNKKDSTKHEME